MNDKKKGLFYCLLLISLGLTEILYETITRHLMQTIWFIRLKVLHFYCISKMTVVWLDLMS